MVFREIVTYPSGSNVWFTSSVNYGLNMKLNSGLIIGSGSQATASFADSGTVNLDDVNFRLGEVYNFRLKQLNVLKGTIYLVY
jgi:hypothetical protein